MHVHTLRTWWPDRLRPLRSNRRVYHEPDSEALAPWTEPDALAAYVPMFAPIDRSGISRRSSSGHADYSRLVGSQLSGFGGMFRS